MSDTCADLQAQIAELRAAVAAIPRFDEGAILAKARQLIEQLTPGIATAVCVGLVNPLKSKIDFVNGVARSAQSKAAEASSLASAADGKAEGALGKIAGLLATLASILLTIAALETLGARIDAVERELQSIGASISQILGSILPGIKALAQNAFNKATTAEDTANYAKAIASAADGRAGRAQETANQASGKADQAIAIANQASGKADAAQGTATTAISIANQASGKADAAQGTATTAIAIANQASGKADAAQGTATTAIAIANQASGKADAAQGTATTALKGLTTLEPKVEKAQGDATTALDEARQANKRSLIPGTPGAPGRNGIDGKPGLPGSPGAPGRNGIDGSPGLPGAPGRNGIDGKPGLPGAPGRNGIDGKPGLLGAPGRNGIDGKPGLKGDKGDKGATDVDARTKALIEQISQNAALIPAIASRPKPLTAGETESAAAAGTCRTTKPGGCMNKLVNDAKDNINQTTNNGVGKILEAFNVGANIEQLKLLKGIDLKIGSQLKNGLSGAVTSVVSNQIVQSAVNYLTLATTIHNGAMLSNNLAQTLFGTVDTILQVFGIGLKDEQGQNAGVGHIIGEAVKATLIKLIGEVEYKVISDNWNKYSRIYQAAANLLNAVQSIGSSILNALNTIGGWNAKVANALKKWGTVGGNAYEWFNPQPNFHNKFFTGLEAATNVVSQVSSIASDTLSVKESVGQVFELKNELKKELKDEDVTKQEAPSIESLREKLKAAKSSEDSASKDLSDDDKTDSED